jgi:hypothetical protein
MQFNITRPESTADLDPGIQEIWTLIGIMHAGMDYFENETIDRMIGPSGY